MKDIILFPLFSPMLQRTVTSVNNEYSMPLLTVTPYSTPNDILETGLNLFLLRRTKGCMSRPTREVELFLLMIGMATGIA